MTKKKIVISVLTLVMLVGLISAAAMVSANPSSDIKAPGKPDFVQDEIIVKFKGDTEPFRVIKTPKGKVMEKVKEYQSKANVVYAEPNYFLSAFSPDDKYYWNQWALKNEGQDIKSGCTEDNCNPPELIGSGTPGADVNWDNAFGMEILGSAIVAILDTGIDETHPDLNDNVWINSGEISGDGLDNDGNSYVDDVNGWDFVSNDNSPHDLYGHGTHVAGTAAAETNNAEGVAGVAYFNVKIMPVQVLNDSGSGSTSGIAKGIRYVVDNGAKAINLSLGGRDSQTLEDAVNYAWDNGVLVAAAAGNDGGGRKYYPASYANAISVAATDYNDNVANFSNFNDQVEISAPGVNVFSTFPVYPFKIQELYGRSRNYDVGSGTSMSVPHVVGLAGLLFAQDENRTNVQVRNIIKETADDLGSSGWDKHFGWGRINVYQALTYGIPVDNDGDGYLSDVDCNDNDPSINPGATEICNGIDDDCDELIDEGFDIDGDGYTSCGGDCDDNGATVNPEATEICDDTIDNDCDGLIDLEDSDCTTTEVCGDGYCAGIEQGEDCFTCPSDCKGTGKDNSRSCCGDGDCINENINNCPIDCL